MSLWISEKKKLLKIDTENYKRDDKWPQAEKNKQQDWNAKRKTNGYFHF